MFVNQPRINNIEDKDFYECLEENDFIGGRFLESSLSSEKVLEDIHINECVFSNVNFENIEFKNVEFMDVVFENCDLSNKRFTKPLTRVIFKNCKLIGLYCSNVSMKDVQFMNCILRFSSFMNTNITNSMIQNNDFKE